MLDETDFELDREIGLIIDFRAQCPRGMEEKLAQALSRKENPEEALLDVLDNAVQSFSRNREADILDKFYDLKKELIQTVQGFVEERTGLTIRARARLKHEKDLGPIRIAEKKIEVSVRETSGTHSVALSAEIHPDPAKQVSAVIAYPRLHALPDKLVDRVRRFFTREVSYHQFHEGLTDPNLRDRFESDVNRMLEAYGHVLERWSIATEVRGGRAPEFVPLPNVNIKQVPYEATEPVYIHNELQLILEDAGRFKASKVSDVKLWAEKELERVINDVTFGMRYMDFLLRFDPVENDIRAAMQARAQEIGYQLRHLIARPDLKEGEWFKPTLHRFTYDDGLPTRATSISVNLEVVVTFELSREGPAETLFNKNIDLYSVMRASIRSQLEQSLHRESPDAVYMRFSVPDQEKPSLEMQLSERIKKHLEKEYRAQVHGFPIIKPLDTEIGTFVEGLIGQSEDFELSVMPLGGRGTYDFRGTISVDSAHEDGWPMIKKQNFDMADLKKHCLDALKTRLDALPYDEMLAYTTPGAQRELEDVARRIVGESIVEHFGFVVRLSNFRRDKSILEKDRSAVQIERERHEWAEASSLLKGVEAERKFEHDSTEKRRAAQLVHMDILDERESKLLTDDDEESRDELATIDKYRRDRLGLRKQRGVETVDEILAKDRERREQQRSLSASVTEALTGSTKGEEADEALLQQLPGDQDGKGVD